ncbi:MAG: DUF1616 domain-containing protein [Candidatus Methanoperedens sp.]
MPNNKDLKIIIVFLFLTLIFVLIPPFNTTPIRIIFGIPMVLFLPGYALIASLFPGKKDLDGIERLALSFGLSIAVVPLIGLVLNFTPFGIRLVPILISLSVFTLVMCQIAYFRRSKLSDEERFEVPFSNMYSSITKELFSPKKGVDKILTIILILSILASIITLIYVIITPIQGEKFTEFYILGDNGTAQEYPTQLEEGKNASVFVGIVNHEYNQENYTVNIILGNVTLNRKQISLIHNATWEEKMYFTPEMAGKGLKLEFLLYKEKNITSAYRNLHLWIDVIPSNNSVQIMPTSKEITFKLDSQRGIIPFNQPKISGNTIEIDPGDKVIWFNDGKIALTLLSDNPKFEAIFLDYYKRASYLFTEPGTYNFYLKNNKNFNSTIIVKNQ